jgi:hypothetical protein
VDSLRSRPGSADESRCGAGVNAFYTLLAAILAKVAEMVSRRSGGPAGGTAAGNRATGLRD